VTGNVRLPATVRTGVNTPRSILDLATVGKGETVAESLAATVDLARSAEANGFIRVWYAEHHNMGRIASSATSVLIAHVAAHTSTIRLGSGGVMLPNHSPLVIAEQFGTLAELHPGRIDLGVGRAPGTDQVTMRALRRDHTAADTFPRDVQELQAYLGDQTLVPGVVAVPGRGTHVPIWILGSSLFGATLAAALGLPYGFASHFAPDHLVEAVATYRKRFTPSDQLAEPYVVAGVNAIAAPSDDEAAEQLLAARRARVGLILGRGRTFTDEEADAALASPQGRMLENMMTHTIVGTPDAVDRGLDEFAAFAEADELMVALPSVTSQGRQQTVALLGSLPRPAG
jgi:luciferase family oxidoreductase group 1